MGKRESKHSSKKSSRCNRATAAGRFTSEGVKKHWKKG